MADRGQLETVLVNLATNARDAMSGKGTITFAAEVETRRWAEARGYPADLKPGHYVRLCVSDTGTGMRPEVLAHASEPFFTTKAKGEGTGLGLAMARGFAEQSGGGLHIESAVGQGTTVRLWFPVAEGGLSPDVSHDEVDTRRKERQRRLLVVDDEPLVREIIANELEAEGYAIASAANGAAALELLNTGEQFDLVISDLSMPGMDGIELVREVQSRRPKLPAILLTGFATNAAEIAVSGAVSGTFSLLRKPITGSQLADRVAMMLEDTTKQSET
jgi:CheY-like chemotaxis protein